MGIIRGDDYRENLRRLKPEVYYLGKKIESVVDHPAFIPHINAVALTYDMALAPEFEELLTAKSHLTGEKISLFTHIHHSTGDLVQKVKALRALGQQTASCFARCVGHDALNAIFSVTHDMDKKKGTAYHQRFLDLLKEIQAGDIFISGAMTDPKGDRSLSPGQQPDPDQYLHVVEKRRDGIVVRGAKVHITGAVNAQGHLVMPTTSLKEADADYAVCFYVPVDAPGLVHVFGRQTNDERKCSGCLIDQGNPEYGIVGGEALVVFDDVFVPWERIFMCGEYEFAFDLVERFATAHRQNYGGCKVGLADVLVGASYALAEAQGTAGASHVRDKLVEMVHLAETLYCCSVACSCQGYALPAGNFMADPLLANVTKLNVTRSIYEMARLAQDLAGGMLATMPSETDWADPRVGKYVDKYLKGGADFPAETRMRLLRLIEGMTCGTALAESMHGAGSPQAQKIMLMRRANWERKKKLAQKLAGIGEHPQLV